jgi:hypothetical protein
MICTENGAKNLPLRIPSSQQKTLKAAPKTSPNSLLLDMDKASKHASEIKKKPDSKR